MIKKSASSILFYQLITSVASLPITLDQILRHASNFLVASTMCERSIVNIFAKREIAVETTLSFSKYESFKLNFVIRILSPPLHHRSVDCIYVYTSHVYFLIRRVFYWNNRSFCLWHVHVRRISSPSTSLKVKLVVGNLYAASYDFSRYQSGITKAENDKPQVTINIVLYFINTQYTA